MPMMVIRMLAATRQTATNMRIHGRAADREEVCTMRPTLVLFKAPRVWTVGRTFGDENMVATIVDMLGEVGGEVNWTTLPTTDWNQNLLNGTRAPIPLTEGGRGRQGSAYAGEQYLTAFGRGKGKFSKRPVRRTFRVP